MDVLRIPVGLDQPFIPGKMCQHTKLDLGIVRVHEDTASAFGTKTLPDQPASSIRTGMFCRFGSVLLIRPCGRDRLIEGAVDSAVRSDKTCQTIRISGFKLCQCPVFQDGSHDRMLRSQLFQHICRCGIVRSSSSCRREAAFFQTRITPSCLGELILKVSPACS